MTRSPRDRPSAAEKKERQVRTGPVDCGMAVPATSADLVNLPQDFSLGSRGNGRRCSVLKIFNVRASLFVGPRLSVVFPQGVQGAPWRRRAQLRPYQRHPVSWHRGTQLLLVQRLLLLLLALGYHHDGQERLRQLPLVVLVVAIDSRPVPPGVTNLFQELLSQKPSDLRWFHIAPHSLLNPPLLLWVVVTRYAPDPILGVSADHLHPSRKEMVLAE